MSFGTVRRFASKKAFRDAVAEKGADAIMVRDTSVSGNMGTVAVSELADSTAVIVGPDVYSDRRWYANVKTNKRTGVITIV